MKILSSTLVVLAIFSFGVALPSDWYPVDPYPAPDAELAGQPTFAPLPPEYYPTDPYPAPGDSLATFGVELPFDWYPVDPYPAPETLV